MDKVFIITHIPKTAGTTLRVHLQKHLKDQYEFIHLANKGDKWAKEKGLQPFFKRTAEQRNQAKVIFGHQVNYLTKTFTEKTPVEIVVFRNPKEWEISRFNQFNNRRNNDGLNTVSFSEWAHEVEKTHSQFDWFLSNYLCLKGETRKLSYRAKTHLLTSCLMHFDIITFTERFSDFSNAFFKQLNISNCVKNENVVGIHKKNYYQSSEKNEKLLDTICRKEIEIFNQIKKKFDRKNSFFPL